MSSIKRDKTVDELFAIAQVPLKKPIRNNLLDQVRDFVEMEAIMGGPNTIPIQVLFYRYVEWSEFKDFMRYDQFLYNFSRLFAIQDNDDSDDILFSLNIEFKEEEARKAMLFYKIQEGIDANEQSEKKGNKKKQTKVSKPRSKV
jgi:hypothetical protein